MKQEIPQLGTKEFNDLASAYFGGGPKQDLEKEMFELEKEMFELEQELDTPSHLRWHNSKPKQETLEEFAKQEAIKQYSEDTFGNLIVRKSIEKGAKWQQERMYSEEDLKEAFIEGYKQRAERSDLIFDDSSIMYAIHLFKEFKNK